MGKRTRRFAVLGALAMASGFFFGTAAARAQSIGLSSATGAAGSSVTINATLSAGGKSVAATTNDIGFDASTPIGTSTQGHCAITSTTACTTSANCPALNGILSSCSNDSTKACMHDSDCTSPGTCPQNEPCVPEPLPACEVNTAIGKSAFFGFLPNYCSNSATTACATDTDCSGGTCTVACTPGTNCTGVRALIFGLTSSSEVSAITDGATLYSCTVNIAATAVNPSTHTLTVSNESAADTTRTLIAGVTGTNGTITVGTGGSYTVCDVSTDTGDNAGQFGDGSIDIFDVRAIFGAAQLGIDAPADGTARFSAMDSSPADVPPACGGDASLDIFDVRACFGVAQFGNTNYVRTGTGASCTSVQAQ